MNDTAPTASLAKGIIFIVLLAALSFWLGEWALFRQFSISPMIIGILLGMVYANTPHPLPFLPQAGDKGVAFCAKRILRLGIILYGFRLTFADVFAVGAQALLLDAFIVCSTLTLGILVGRAMRLDPTIALLTAVGSSICGAAAVLGAEAAIKAKPYQTAVAVATVVIFGTTFMFLYPMLYRAGVFTFSPHTMGLYTGATVHEVAHVVGAGNAIGTETASVAIIVKMIRVMMLVPVLLGLSWWAARSAATSEGTSGKIAVPWFALGFLLVICFNSLSLLPASVVNGINTFDTFLLTMAMTALGADTSMEKFRKAGAKPFVLAFVLALWLIGAGWTICRFCL